MTQVKLELNAVRQGAFYLYEEDAKAGEMTVNVDSVTVTVYHTEVFDGYENKGYAKQLFDAMVAYAREHQLMVNPLCPYVYAQFHRHPDQYADVWNISHNLSF